jgi:Fe-S-cluster containining protein
MNESVPLTIDLELVRGFRFTCRSDCGLCCYAHPRVESEEVVRLLEIVPTLELKTHGRDRFIASRPNGGACQFLEQHRCRVHVARPRPCREFPLTVHLGRRLQASVVLSCPGVDLSHLVEAGDRHRIDRPVGFDDEIRALQERLGPATAARLADTARRGRKLERRLAAEGRWEDDETVRRALREHLPRPGPEDFPASDPPSAADGLERLPVFFDDRPGPVALAQALGGWELLELSPKGGATTLGVFPPLDRPPTLDESARAIFDGYVRYWIDRDCFLAAVHIAMTEGEQGSVIDWAEGELRAIGAEVLARSVARAKLRGRATEPLGADALADGIRATDQDWLDRPTWGDRL